MPRSTGSLMHHGVSLFPDGKVPGEEGASLERKGSHDRGGRTFDISFPILTPYWPKDTTNPASHTAIIVAPGGAFLWLTHTEGAAVARWLAQVLGVTAFLLSCM